MAFNYFAAMGRLTRSPELKQTNGGKEVTSFTIAVDRGDKDKTTDFINCVAWNQTAEFISKYFEKGAQILVEGRLQIRKYEDRDGNKREAAEIIVNHAHFAGAKNSTASDAPGADTNTAPAQNWSEAEDEELPF